MNLFSNSSIGCSARTRRLRFEPLEDRRMLAVFTVDNITDFGPGSLRQAINDANAAAGADTVEFSQFFSGTINLTSGELTITDELVIDGPGSENLTIDASGNDPTRGVQNGDGSRIFNIDEGNDANFLDVEIRGLTLTGGDVTGNGGAILSRENLRVVDSTISGNASINDRDDGYGGGIYSLGDVDIDRSEISDNVVFADSRSRAAGGGIAGRRNVTVIDSLVARNSATGDIFAEGGGIAAAGDITISGSTITANLSTAIDADFTSGGGGVFGQGSVTVTASTVTGNVARSTVDAAWVYGGGILATEQITITDSVVSGNYVRNEFGESTGGGIHGHATVLISGSTISGNAALSGEIPFVRASGGGGVWAGEEATVSRSTIFGNWSTGPDASGGGIQSRADITIDDSIVSGNDATLRGGGIYAAGSVNVATSTISGNSLDGGDPLRDSVRGGGIAANLDVTINESTVSGNSARAGNRVTGGGLYARNKLDIIDSNVTDNIIDGYLSYGAGGAAQNGGVTVSGSSIARNSGIAVRRGRGGGLLAVQTLLIEGSAFTDNSIDSDLESEGGGIFGNASVLVSGSIISGNSADSGDSGRSLGGGILASDNLTVRNSVVSDNSVVGGESAFGGGLLATDSLTISNSTISANSVAGGLLASSGGARSLGGLTIIGSTITENRVTGGSLAASTGGISSGSEPAVFVNSIVAGNVAASFPDLRIRNGLLTFSHSLIGNNLRTGIAEAPVGMPDANGNLVGTGLAPIDPLLGPLRDNGGPTFTHALLPGSPAIDAGDNTGAPPTDQRGFVRIVDGGSGQKIIDMGAVEFGATLAGDGNGDGFVGDADYTVWANNVGLSGENIPGDYNNDGVVGPQDYTVWANNFGAGTPPSESAMSVRPVEPALQNLRDSDHSTFGFRHSSFDEVVAGLLTEPLTQGATGSASASGAESAANLQQHHRLVEPALRIATSAGRPTPILGVPPALSRSGDHDRTEGDRDRTAVDDSVAGAATLRRDKTSGSLVAAHDAAIQELMIEGLGRHDPISRSSIDHVWALLNAGLLETDHDQMLIDVSERGR